MNEKYNNLLKQHVKRRHKEKTIKCDQCDKWFAFNGDLKRHVKGNHEEKTIKCDQCDGWFGTDWGLKQHVKRRHEEKTSQTLSMQRGRREYKKG